ncbi:MAG: hypothetical protein BWY90_00681 [Deltaproteobacteria bacterium ADurb.BinA014]|nr:MAG: hypothetical protein BWY90_00681 [Deltaproteobacteria bacterium ADurb.BinA014]
MRHFRMKLQAIKTAGGILSCRHLRIARGGGGNKSLRQLTYGIAVTHPAGGFCFHTRKNSILFFYVQFGKAVFALLGADNFAAQGFHHKLHAVADAQNRNAKIKDVTVRARRAFGVDTCRTAG